MKALLNNIIHLGITPRMDKFKASRVKTLNGIVLIFIFAYLATFPLSFYLDIAFVSIVLTVLLASLGIPLYFSYKRKYALARYSLTLNAWILTLILSYYLGEEGGHVYTLGTSAVLWFIIYNRPVELIIIEILNTAVAAVVIYFYSALDPIWEGDPHILAPLRITLMVLSVLAALITVAVFKVNNQKYIETVELQKQLIKAQKEEMESSIRYAKSIQDGFLTQELVLDNISLKSFVLFKPKDIVSGDFYWLKEDEDKICLVLGDCTGHGVAGAMISIMGFSSLESSINKNAFSKPSHLLKSINDNFNSKMSRSNLQDGMDVSVLMWFKKTQQWIFSGANSSIALVTGGDIEIIKGDRRPIGNYHEPSEAFSDIVLNTTDSTCIYLYSDGYRDQFGGEKGKKLGMRLFKNVLKETSNKPIELRQTFLEHQLTHWQQSNEQTDDISVIGIDITSVKHT